MAKQYDVEVVVEGGCGTVLFQASALPIDRMREVLNRRGMEGWTFNFMTLEQKRFLLFWKREAAIMIFSRDA